jgi:hypothetical protein
MPAASWPRTQFLGVEMQLEVLLAETSRRAAANVQHASRAQVMFPSGSAGAGAILQRISS